MRAVARVMPHRGNVLTLPGQRRDIPTEALVWGAAVTPVAAETDSRLTERNTELDAHRGLAVLAIVVFTVYQFCNVDHFLYRGTLAYTILDSLDAAVPWLFVISGFLLFRPLARSVLVGEPAPSTAQFLLRRAVKLIPAYYVVVLVVWFSRQHSLPGDWRDLLEHLTFTQIFDEKRIFYTNGPGWAVSVAVYFYLVIAGLGVVLPSRARRLPSRRQRLYLLVAVVVLPAAASLLWKGYSFGVAHHTTVDAFTAWFGPLANLDNFAAGMAIAVLTVALDLTDGLSGSQRMGLRLIAAVVLGAAFASRQATGWSGVYFTSECSVGFACLIAAAATGRSHAGLVLRWRPLTQLGTVSYGIYLWHEPILLALHSCHIIVRQSPDALLRDEAVVLPISILVGSLSYLAIERPTRQLVILLMRRNQQAAGSRQQAAGSRQQAAGSKGKLIDDTGAAPLVEAK